MLLGEQAARKPVAAEVLTASRWNLQALQAGLFCRRKPGVWIRGRYGQHCIDAGDLDLERGFHRAIFSSCQTVGADLAAINTRYRHFAPGCAPTVGADLVANGAAEVFEVRARVPSYAAETIRTARPLAS